MRLIETIIKNNYKTVSIAGLAKNAGKTVALNYLIEESLNYDLAIGITSAGRDGETIDLVTNTQKPSVYAVEGMYAATGKKALLLSDVRYEVLETTGINTPMGELVIIKVRQNGSIQIAGPVNAADMKYICKRLNYYGAKTVFIDGAVDRRAVSSPMVTDACIIATGAVLSRDMKKVINLTSFAVECCNLEQIDENIKKIILKYNKTCIIQKNSEVILPDINISLAGGKKISDNIDENTKYIFIRGAITTDLLKAITDNEFCGDIKYIVEDGTKIFVDLKIWSELRRKGLKLFVLYKTDVIAVTVNPVSPAGYFFDSDEFIENLSHSIPEIKIIDVMSGGEEN